MRKRIDPNPNPNPNPNPKPWPPWLWRTRHVIPLGHCPLCAIEEEDGDEHGARGDGRDGGEADRERRATLEEGLPSKSKGQP